MSQFNHIQHLLWIYNIYVRLQSLSKTLQLVFATKRYHVGVSNIFYMSNDDYQLARLGNNKKPLG